jgi:hypothetical protein
MAQFICNPGERMKMKVLILLVPSLFACMSALAQGDSATHYVHGLPVSEDDTVQNFPVNDYPPFNKVVTIPHQLLPEKILKSLRTKSEFKGWEQLPVLKEVNTGIYRIRIAHENDTTHFGLNENGKVVTYEINSDDEQ